MDETTRKAVTEIAAAAVQEIFEQRFDQRMNDFKQSELLDLREQAHQASADCSEFRENFMRLG